jgi:hypothetical protein
VTSTTWTSSIPEMLILRMRTPSEQRTSSIPEVFINMATGRVPSFGPNHSRAKGTKTWVHFHDQGVRGWVVLVEFEIPIMKWSLPDIGGALAAKRIPCPAKTLAASTASTFCTLLVANNFSDRPIARTLDKWSYIWTFT